MIDSGINDSAELMIVWNIGKCGIDGSLERGGW